MCVRCSCCRCKEDCCQKFVDAAPKVHGDVRVVNEWREGLEKTGERSRVLEALFAVLPPLIGLNRWEIRCQSYENAIVGVVSGKTLHEFTAYVRQLSYALGPPESFDFESVYEDRAPDFSARWRIKVGTDHPRVLLRSERPECKMDPRTTYKSPKIEGDWQHPKLHPECRAALDALKDELEDDFNAKGFYESKLHGHEVADEYKEAIP